MKKYEKILAGLVLGLLSTTLALGAAYYKDSVKEGGSFMLVLSEQSQGSANPDHSMMHDSTMPNMPGMAKPVQVDIAREGFPKRLFQPGLIDISTHGIVNKDKRAHILQFELTNSSLPVKWHINDSAWDRKNHILNRPLKPGETIALELMFDVQEQRNKLKIYNGNLKVIDYQTKEQLGIVPIKIINSRAKGAENTANNFINPGSYIL